MYFLHSVDEPHSQILRMMQYKFHGPAIYNNKGASPKRPSLTILGTVQNPPYSVNRTQLSVSVKVLPTEPH